MADLGFVLPDDTFVPILLLLPTSSRRRLRLVCKRWHDLIDQRTPELQVHSEILVFINKSGSSRTVVFDGKDGRRRHVWTFRCSHERSNINMIGTCNGLLCLHESITFGGTNRLSTIKVTNPITEETLALPPVPTSWEWEQIRAPGKYTFGYHPTTGRYNVVHIPCGRRQAVDVVRVFTLGDTAWREVPVNTSGASYNRYCDAVTVDGSTYWLAMFSNQVMALDLKDEHVTSFNAPPTKCPCLIPSDAGWKLTDVHARLGVVVTAATGVEVWVLEGGGEKQPRWSRRYNVAEARWGFSWIMVPQLTHGNCILSTSQDETTERYFGISRWRRRLYRHKEGDLTDGDSKFGWPPKGAELVMSEEESNGDLMTSAYVETREPLPSICG